MQIAELRKRIEEKSALDFPLIFIYKKSGLLICDQYIKAISSILKKPIYYYNSIPEKDPFGGEVNQLSVIRVDSLSDEELPPYSIVECTKSTSKYDTTFFPDLEEWMLKGYVEGVLKGLENKDKEWLLSKCSDPYLLFNEVDKLIPLTPANRKLVFDQFLRSGGYSYLKNEDIFKVSNSIISRDVATLNNLFRRGDRVKVEPMALLSILVSNFRDILKIKSSTNSNPGSLNMPPARFNILKKYCYYYSFEQLYNIIDKLTDIDYKLKSGELDYELIEDYIVTHVLGS